MIGAMDKNTEIKRLRLDAWMIPLNTLRPKGLNSRW